VFEGYAKVMRLWERVVDRVVVFTAARNADVAVVCDFVNVLLMHDD
jgi:hypothetical protein